MTAMSWEPVPLVGVDHAGSPAPELSGIGYLDTLTVVYAEPDGLKSWEEAVVCLEAIRGGRNVIWVDFEMNAPIMLDRLRSLGATDEEIARFAYVRPSDPLTDEATRARVEALVEQLDPAAVVIDAMAGVLALHGLSAKSDDDIERLYSLILRPFRRPSTALRIIDHVVKDRESRGRWPTGSQRKLGGADVGLTLELIKPFSRGGTGKARIRVTKDRLGGMPRPYAAELTLTSDADTGRITWALEPVGETTDPEHDWRPTVLMDRVLEFLSRHDGPATRTQIKTGTGGKSEYVGQAIDFLLLDERIIETPGARNAKLISLPPAVPVPDPFPEQLGTTERERPVPVPSTTKGNDSGNGSRERLNPFPEDSLDTRAPAQAAAAEASA
jgi:hypothetical protein